MIKALKSSEFSLDLINTGQHSDYHMNQAFVEELVLPSRLYDLKVDETSRTAQLASILTRLSKLLKVMRPDLVLVLGDTTSTLGGAMVAAQSGFPLGHIEAGCRSFDWRMPEELNRVLADDLSDLHFVPTLYQKQNLVKEGTSPESMWIVGDPTVELLDSVKNESHDEEIIDGLGLSREGYYLMTVHRAENITSASNLGGVLKASSILAKSHPVVFPLHPHTRRQIYKFGLQRLLQGLYVIDPQPYKSMIALISNSLLVLTDSGGLQHEAPLLGRFCVTMRRNTEWVETVNLGVNFLAGTNPNDILEMAQGIESSPHIPKRKSTQLRKLLGDGTASEKIAEICKHELPRD